MFREISPAMSEHTKMNFVLARVKFESNSSPFQTTETLPRARRRSLSWRRSMTTWTTTASSLSRSVTTPQRRSGVSTTHPQSSTSKTEFHTYTTVRQPTERLSEVKLKYCELNSRAPWCPGSATAVFDWTSRGRWDRGGHRWNAGENHKRWTRRICRYIL